MVSVCVCVHRLLLLCALFLRALDFRAPSFIVNKGCVIGKKNVASEFLLSISAYFTFAHTPFTRTIYFCDLRVKGVPSVPVDSSHKAISVRPRLLGLCEPEVKRK